MDHGFAPKHMTSHRTVFDTYKVIIPHNICLDNKSIMKAIKPSSVVIEVMVNLFSKKKKRKKTLHAPKL